MAFKHIHGNSETAVEFIYDALKTPLDEGKTVTWLMSGGSAIDIEAKVADKLVKNTDCHLLNCLLMDERFGSIGHRDSNWQQLLDAKFAIPDAQLYPTLIGNESITETTAAYIDNYQSCVDPSNVVIGLFGIGSDGHTAGILPFSPAVSSQEVAIPFLGADYERITLTPPSLQSVTQAIVYAMGNMKWPVIEDLLNESIPLDKQPAQLLNSIADVTIISDYKNLS